MVIQFIRKTKEFWAVLFVVLLLVISQRQVWITKERMLSHDSIRWYGIFSYFSDCLHNGVLPLWNPYMNCGEPFFLNIDSMRIWDPSTLLLIGAAKLIKIDFFNLYHLDLLLKYIIFICGCYLFFRYIARYKASAFIAFISIVFSSLGVSYLRQHSFIILIYTLPWILLFFFKFLDAKKPIDFCGLVFFLGLAVPAYNSLHLLIFVFILFLSLLTFGGWINRGFIEFFKNYRVTLLGLIIFLLLTLRLIPQGLYYFQNIIPTLRMYEVRYVANSLPADLLNLITPYYFIVYFIKPGALMSEAFLYIGLLPLLLLIVGIWLSPNRFKVSFLFTALITLLLMLGDKSVVFRLFNKYFPFFSIIRNMHDFSSFFLFCLGCLVCMGSDFIFESVCTSRFSIYEKYIIFIIVLICILVFSAISYFDNSAKNLYEDFNSEVLSLGNLVLFLVPCIAVYLLLREKAVGVVIVSSFLISFILFDLIHFQHTMFPFVTSIRRKDNFEFPALATKPSYRDYRMLSIQSKSPSFAFLPIIFKEFTCYDIPSSLGTHFFETKDYYEFSRNKIPNDIRGTLAGVSSPKLRLVKNVTVLSRDSIIDKLEGIDADGLENIVFLEESLPERYAHLEIPLNSTEREKKNLGKIEVIYFNPNEIVLDVYATEDTLLYYSDGYDKAWKVFIDGREEKVYKANVAFKSCPVSEGRHKVRFLYDPKFYKFGLYMYFSGLFGVLVLAILWLIIRFKKGVVERI